jgi:6-phosphogluconolactonase
MISPSVRWKILLAALLFALVAPSAVANDQPSQAARSKEAFVYIGTYTGGSSRGIYEFQMDLASGELKPAGMTPSDNPSYLATDPARRFLFAVGEIGHFRGKQSGSVSAFIRNAENGALSPLNQQPSDGGAPCHLVVDPTGRNLFVANYVGGSVAVLPIAGDGRLRPASSFVQHVGSGPNRGRQEKAHAHGIALSPDNRFALVADLGTDRIYVYRFDAERGIITPNQPPWNSMAPGSGPRHIVFHPNGRFVYAVNELNSTITLMTYDAQHGRLESRQIVSTLPENATLPQTGNTCAELQIHPSGRFLYGSNRGNDSIAIFSIDPTTGRLTSVEFQPTGGHTPRGFAVDPAGKWLITGNQDSGNVVEFRIDSRTGRLMPSGIRVKVDMPVCVEIIGK